MELCKAICAFRERFSGRFVEAMYPGQMVQVPGGLVQRLVADGHIEKPEGWMPPAEAEPQPVVAEEPPAVEAKPALVAKGQKK